MTNQDDDIVKVDFAFKRLLAETVEGDLANFCYQCGACVGDCPATTYSEDFNPREIMLKVLYGLESELIGEDSIVWQCTNCYNCHERCPQEVKPVDQRFSADFSCGLVDWSDRCFICIVRMSMRLSRVSGGAFQVSALHRCSWLKSE